MSLELHIVSSKDDLEAICAQMHPQLWDDVNQMTSYDPETLKRFLETGNVLVLVYEGDKIAGAAVASEILHPSKNSDTLFINEVDTHPDFRRRGVATMLMQEMLKIAKERGLSEAWVGADKGNEPAHALYRSLNPDEIEEGATNYSFKIKS